MGAHEQGHLWQASIDVVLWAIAQHDAITTEAIVARWGKSRATAFRWRDPLEDARQRAMFMPRPTAARTRSPTTNGGNVEVTLR